MEQTQPAMRTIETRCCIVGGGPAGMMLGLLLARAGVEVQVLEKHADFFRDFRGDTIHPSTLELMHELGVLSEFLQRPHQEVAQAAAQIGDFTVSIADFTHLPTQCKFIALMPQWDFLSFIAEQGRRYPGFHLRMEAEAMGVVEERGRIVGVRAQTPEGALEVRADLTIGADGRHSIVRRQAGLEVLDLGAPIDVLWMRIARHSHDPEQTLGRFRAGKILVTLNRGEYWQCAYIIPKGAFEGVQSEGLAAFREDIASVAPFLRQRLEGMADWSEVKLLAVAVDRLRRWWRPGLLCIGDSAHAMSPVGGVGINLAIQDAVAAANILASPLLRGAVGDADLARAQKRRELPTRMTQRLQVFAHKRMLVAALGRTAPIRRLPLPFRLLNQFPLLRRVPARVIGLGFRREHIRTPIRTPDTP